jgi:hypothetical protein
MPNKTSIFRFADVEVHEREFSLIKSGEGAARRAQGLSHAPVLASQSPEDDQQG